MNKRESVRTTADAAEREPVRSRSFDNEDGKTVARIVTEKIHRERYLAEYAPLFDGSAAMRAVREMLENIADTDATVMLRGESGVGKDLVARAIHAASKRCNGAFIKVNCAAIPPGLLESELFGHEKGAFTGAHRRKPGQFEYANQGTIYLDEVADLPLSLQAKLLHVLQDLRFSRVGGHGTIDVDVRVVAATNRDLEQALARGDFREDLYYRLNVVEIRIPPLRERKEESCLPRRRPDFWSIPGAATCASSRTSSGESWCCRMASTCSRISQQAVGRWGRSRCARVRSARKV